MDRKSSNAKANCGQVRKTNLPKQLTKNDPPITLAKVTADIGSLRNPCVLFNYSQFISFRLNGPNPIISLTYRLTRTSPVSEEPIILEEWIFKGKEVIPTPAPPLNTIEPLVTNFCDCNVPRSNDLLTYTFQLVEVTTNNAIYDISNQEVSAIMICGSEHK
ncbi:DUF4489 domain-containing protein [Pseudalkalibacillus berkeleyi]|uniref:DUF4489 domain-containing protein n=1 Tax=Pseudalkalibacillus berkeleyi TaxID=1069813 RepID=A0ABS9GXC8_9BACL|nr:DUF4489 domain-containing protein [Pseudalkalibacillus berkeleyi]MCF6137432.1 DUF4489 domain-containing protein [Pseudalkalibacillus berkeleyi]